jgi:hypothetical protein
MIIQNATDEKRFEPTEPYKVSWLALLRSIFDGCLETDEVMKFGCFTIKLKSAHASIK